MALKLTTAERAQLASKLLESLPPVLVDDDGGVAEAFRRQEELQADPDIGISMEELRTKISERFDL
jgi:putative addiction module component (TIGR02574 family)